MRILAVLLAIVLAGCASKVLNENLPHLVGKDIQFAINVLGAPSSVSEFGETRFVSWSVNHRGSMILPTTSTSNTTGYIGSTPVYGSTTSSGTMVVPTSAVCTVTLHVRNETVTRWEWRGNEAGCETFASRVKSLSN